MQCTFRSLHTSRQHTRRRAAVPRLRQAGSIHFGPGPHASASRLQEAGTFLHVDPIPRMEPGPFFRGLALALPISLTAWATLGLVLYAAGS